MREYLFRGKRTDNKGWVYGHYFTEIGRGVAGSNDTLIYFIKDKFGTHPVLPETVCQYTGIDDKNGAKVFEGDRIKSEKYEYYITFENGAFYAYHTSIKDYMGYPYRWGLVSRFNELCMEIEVIGNIHDK